MLDLMNRLVKEEDGQGMVEYGLIVGIIAIALVAILGTFGDSLTALFGRFEADIDGVDGP